MDNSTLRQKALEGLDGLEAPQLPSWESLPQLDLYMDQVIAVSYTHLDVYKRQLQRTSSKATLPSLPTTTPSRSLS